MNLLPQFASRHDNIDSLLNQVHHADAMELLARLPDGKYKNIHTNNCSILWYNEVT